MTERDDDDLSHGRCEPCGEASAALSAEEIRALLDEVPGWEVQREGGMTRLGRTMAFRDFREALAFVNRVGEIAELEGHHPDIHIEGWNKVRLQVYTHSIGGLHRNDFVLAAKVNRLRGEG